MGQAQNEQRPFSIADQFDALRRDLSSTESRSEVIGRVADFISECFQADLTEVVYGSERILRTAERMNGQRNSYISPNIQLHQGIPVFEDQRVELPHFCADVTLASKNILLADYLSRQAVSSYAAIAIYVGGGVIGYVLVGFVKRFFTFQSEDVLLLQQLADYLLLRVERGEKPKVRKKRSQIDRSLLESTVSSSVSAGGGVLLTMRRSGVILHISETFSNVFGLDREKFIGKKLPIFLARVFPAVKLAELKKELLPLFRGSADQVSFSVEDITEKTAPGSYTLHGFSLLKHDDLVLLSLFPPAPKASTELTDQVFQHVVEQGNLIILRTDSRFRIQDFFGDTEQLFGLSKKAMLEREDVWADFLHPRDLRRLNLRLGRIRRNPREFSEEVRVISRRESTPEIETTRWLMLRAVPCFSSSGDLVGWEGYGVDITDKRMFEIELRSQRKRIEALYEVSRAVRFNLDPALVALKGLRALIRATSSDCGFACFYAENTGQVEMVAAEHHSNEYLEAVSEVVNGKSLVRYAIEHREGLLIDNIQEDERAAVEIAKMEDLRSTIVMPLMFEQKVLGAIVLFCHKEDRYNVDDFDLVAAAANQIALTARQAEYYTKERRQADSLAVLYRLSHELSKLFTPREVADHSFSVIQSELACRRLWLGVVNEQGTHLIGQGGSGPGVRRQLQEVQIELTKAHQHLDEALETKQPVIVEGGEKMICSGLDRLVDRLQLGTFVILPLVSVGQVVGVMFIEPVVSSPSFVRKKLPLLTAMASEIASVLLARRFESKMAGADKMRMAAVLASGVAHNFNNLLQAVMGQASLIEMQLPEDSPVRESAETIIEAAGKGAGLVKHLQDISSQGIIEPTRFVLGELISESRDFYHSIVGSGVKLELQPSENTGKLLANQHQVQQIVTNLLMNAREAIGDRTDGVVKVRVQSIQLRSGEIDPELAPGNYIRLDVEDNGSGMDEETSIRCFEPFFSTKDLDTSSGISLSGSGLGLSSAYSLARQHQGIITVSSNLGEGSVFSVFLPEAIELPMESLSTSSRRDDPTSTSPSV